MSRTYRKNRHRAADNVWRRITGPEQQSNSLPFKDRHVTPEGKKQAWFCRCDYCIHGKLHKNHRQGFPIHWELDQLQYTNSPEID